MVVGLSDLGAPLRSAVRDRGVRQQRVAAGAVPVLLVWLGPDDVAKADYVHAGAAGDDATPRRHDEELTTGVAVPVGARARGEDDRVDRDLPRVEHRVHVDRTGERRGPLLGALATGPSVRHVHAGQSSISPVSARAVPFPLGPG